MEIRTTERNYAKQNRNASRTVTHVDTGRESAACGVVDAFPTALRVAIENCHDHMSLKMLCAEYEGFITDHGIGRQRMRRRTPHLSHRVPSLDETSMFSYVEGTPEDNMRTRFVDTWTRGTSTGQVVLLVKRKGED